MQLHLPDERLKLCRLVEAVVEDHFGFQNHGLYFGVNYVKPVGKPLERIQVQGTLHFLALGSPFTAFAQDDGPSWFRIAANDLAEELAKRLRLRQSIELEFVGIGTVVHGAVFDNKYGSLRTPVPDSIDEPDALGRTALWRAAHRGYEHQVAELLNAGASPNIVGPNGKTLLEQAMSGELDIEIAIALLDNRQVT